MQDLPAGQPDTDSDSDSDSDSDTDGDSDSNTDTDTDTGSEYLPEFAGKLTSIWGANAYDIWAGGFDGTLLHWDGLEWKMVPTHSDACIRDINGSASDDIWMAGYGRNAEHEWYPTNDNHFAHFDGVVWTNHPTGPVPLFPDAVHVFSPVEAYTVVSNNYNLLEPPPPPALGKFDGAEWKYKNFGDLAGTTYSGGNFAAIAASWEGDLFIVGHQLDHYDGSSWSEDSTNGVRYWDVWARADDDAFSVGEGGEIRRFNGSNWPLMTTPVDVDLRGVWGSAPDDVFAVGKDAIVHYDGTEWSEMTLPTVNNLQLMGVWGTGSDNVYAVGGHGEELDEYGNQLAAILHYDSAIWSVSYLVIQ